ncbi:MAG: TonB-dependent receptor plug domain-containing protein [Verrucomicrobia bacterium]|nr:TonB-dependent receptor plug domain-containing protein [Verrucomicrobiota bacterium]
MNSCRWLVLAFCLAALSLPTDAADSAPPSAPSTPRGPGNEAVSLSPFEVRADSDNGYTAATAMSGTRTNERLENLPNSISVMTQEFLQDLALNSYFDAVDFAMNAENIANDLGTIGAVVNNRGGNQVNIRGLASVRQLRDGFPWYLSTDSYNTERIEFGRGPGGLAYGDVDAGGSINIGSKRATFQQRASAQVRYDTFGTQRYSVDISRPLVPGKVGLRFNAIRSEVEMFQQRMGRDLEGYAVALRFEPFKHRRTQIDVLGETGNTTYHLGHLGPTDSRIAYVPGTGNSNLDADPNRAGTQVNGVGMAQLRAPTAVIHAIVDVGGVINNWQSTAQNTFRITVTNTAAAATSATDPQNPNRFPLRRIPESIIPLREDWAGPDNKMASKYHAYTVELKHAFTDRLSGLVAFNAQVDETVRKQTYSSLASVGGVAGRSVHVDVNPILPNPNGPGTVPNPNYGQMFIVHAPLYNPDGHDIMGWRGQLVYDARLPWDITQRLVLGANYRHEENYQDNFGYSLTREEIQKRGFTGQAAYFNNNLVYPIHYLRDGNSDAALGWNVRPGVTQLFRHVAGSGVNRRLDQSLTSGFANLLGSYFKGRVRTSVGLSRDHWLQSASLPTTADPTNFNQHTFFNADGTRLPNDGLRKLDVPVFPFANEWSTNQTYGAVWHALSWLSFTAGYFESSQFSDNYGTDLTGGALQPLTGEGVDLSARFKLLGGRVEATVTRFETKQENLNSSLVAEVRDELAPLLAKPFANLVDYRDRTAEGWEFQVVSNLTRQWTLVAGYSWNTTEYTRFFPLLEKYLTEARTTARARGLDPDGATTLTREYLEDQEGAISRTKRATGSLTTRYSFTEGRLRGVTTGVAARYTRGRDRAGVTISGVQVLPPSTTEDYILVNPFVAYRRKLGRFNWTLQLNVNNVFDEKVDVGNGYTWARYTEPRQYVTTLTVGF